jgi:hypothetical protein
VLEVQNDTLFRHLCDGRLDADRAARIWIAERLLSKEIARRKLMLVRGGGHSQGTVACLTHALLSVAPACPLGPAAHSTTSRQNSLRSHSCQRRTTVQNWSMQLTRQPFVVTKEFIAWKVGGQDRRVVIRLNSDVLCDLDQNQDPVYFDLDSMVFFADRASFISSTTPAQSPSSS